MKIDEDRWSRLICSGVGCDKRWQEVNIRAVLCDRCWPRWEDRLPVVWPEPDNRRWLGWQVSACGSSAGWMPGQRYLTRFCIFLPWTYFLALSGFWWEQKDATNQDMSKPITMFCTSLCRGCLETSFSKFSLVCYFYDTRSPTSRSCAAFQIGQGFATWADDYDMIMWCSLSCQTDQRCLHTAMLQYISISPIWDHFWPTARQARYRTCWAVCMMKVFMHRCHMHHQRLQPNQSLCPPTALLALAVQWCFRPDFLGFGEVRQVARSVVRIWKLWAAVSICEHGKLPNIDLDLILKTP